MCKRFKPLLIGAAALPGSCTTAICRRHSSFNPLLIGAAALPPDLADIVQRWAGYVSIPFSSGRQRCRKTTKVVVCRRSLRFNPLLIGAAALPGSVTYVLVLVTIAFQSPSHRGGSAACVQLCIPRPLSGLFQSPSHRGGSAAVCKQFQAAAENGRFNPLLIGAAALPIWRTDL